MLHVVEINAIEHLEAIRLRWTSLFYETPGASFFQTLDWLQVYWHHFRRDQRLRVLLVHRNGTVLGILPLVVRVEMTATGLAEAITYPTIAPHQFFGPIGPNPTATLMASLRYLSSRSRDWDVLSLGEIGEHDLGRTANALELAGLYPHETVRSTIAKLCLDARRANLEHQVEFIGGLTFERIRPLGNACGEDPHVDGIIEACCELIPSRPADKQPPTLLRDVAAVASRLGMLDLNLLRLHGRLTAYSLNVHLDGAIQQISAGEAAAAFDFQPASVLSLRMVQDSISRKDRYIYAIEPNGGLANVGATEQLPFVRYQHLASRPIRDRLVQFSRWLASPVTNV